MDYQGLTQAEVLERKKKGLANDVPEKVSRSYKEIVIGNTVTWFNMIIFLLGAILVLLGKPLDALFATGILILNILIATVQECKAKRRLDAIALLIRPTVKAIRDGQIVVIGKNDIVIDDIILLSPGDQMLVDGELLEAQYLEIDESVMTGESSTVKKRKGDRVLSGSFCIAGEGCYKVTAVGRDTVATKMMDNVKKTSNKNTPMQKELQALIKIMIVLGLVLFVLMEIAEFLTGSFDGKPLDEIINMMTIKAVLALDVVPLALFLTIIISYMVAAIRMADSGVLLQRANSVESMSHVDTVCMDKTGTITTQRLLFESMKAYADLEESKRIIRAFANSTGSKNRTVQALIEHYGAEDIKATQEIRFSSERKFSAVKVEIDGEAVTIFTGAITSFGNRFRNTNLDSDVNNFSRQGLRTLVITTGPDVDLEADDFELPELRLIAVVAIRDELRQDCRETIQKFIDAGMDIKVISGDDPVMVDALFSIARIPGRRKIVSGTDLAKMEGEEKIHTILNGNIFGRMKPEQKEDVIKTLKENGRYVAMVGDGVNDVRSLKEANVGISLESGTGAAKGVSDMVLLKDRFSSLPVALVEGRRTVSGMSDLLKVYITRNFTLGVLMLLACVLFAFYFAPVRPFELRAATVYGALTVSIPTLLMIIWAKPEGEFKHGILPGVLRYTVPMAILFGIFGFILFFGFQYAAEMNWIARIPSDVEVTGTVLPYVNGQGVLLMFLIITGILQIMFVCPYNKFMSLDGNVKHDRRPMILMVILLLMTIATYVLNDNLEWFHHLLPLVSVPLEQLPIVLLMVAVWFFLSRAILRSTFFNGFSDWIEHGFEKQSVKIDEKDAESEAKKDEFWDKVNNFKEKRP